MEMRLRIAIYTLPYYSMDMDTLTAHDILKKLSESGESDTEIANATGIPQPTISRIRSGAHADPRESTAIKIRAYWDKHPKRPQPNPALSTRIEQASECNVTRPDLRPDDWYLIWPELIPAYAHLLPADHPAHKDQP
jgi:hypothetical protein